MTPDEILEKHLSLMLGRTDESYISIDEMKQSPEWQTTINAMIEYAKQDLKVFGLYDPQDNLMFVHQTYDGCNKHKLEFANFHGSGFYVDEIKVLD
jgi:hypothetical protein